MWPKTPLHHVIFSVAGRGFLFADVSLQTTETKQNTTCIKPSWSFGEFEIKQQNCIESIYKTQHSQ